MTLQEKTYPYDRILMLNALDDLFGLIGARILSSQSREGVVEVCVPNKHGDSAFRFCVRSENGHSSLSIETVGGPMAGSRAQLEEESKAVHELFVQIDRLLCKSTGETPDIQA